MRVQAFESILLLLLRLLRTIRSTQCLAQCNVQLASRAANQCIVWMVAVRPENLTATKAYLENKNLSPLARELVRVFSIHLTVKCLSSTSHVIPLVDVEVRFLRVDTKIL